MDKLTSQYRIPAEGAQLSSIVEKFSIEGLFGYRSIGLNSEYAATVLIARNGTGKTTLLAALDAFLKGQFIRFSSLEFTRINCKLRDIDSVLSISRHEIDDLIAVANTSEVSSLAKAWELDPLTLIELVETDTTSLKHSDIVEHPLFYNIYAKCGYDFSVVKSSIERLALQLTTKAPTLSQLRQTVRSALSGYDIVYLPTYRRIELSLPSADHKRGERKKNVMVQLGISRRGLYTADIQFGLGDITDRLRALYSDMLVSANREYGKISANIINDLISGAFRSSATTHRELPTKESLELFFARIKDGERDHYRRIPYANLLTAPNLDSVFNDDAPDDAKPFLAYFLDQLNLVIKETRGTEELVEAFTGSCNAYLSGDIDSNEIPKEEFSSFDWKKIKFHKRNLQVSIQSVLTRAKVPLESLSSGEKQMISLFARLYLYPGKKIFLIDEPELSLSLAWQRRILPDLLRAPSCRQIIAITHSPFIFDNELDPYAGTLHFEVAPTPTDELFPDSLSDDTFDES